jgi:tetratricopeptide (TPR) repeat protein
LALSPDLSLAHTLYVSLEVEMGRCQEAMIRLLDRARQRTNDADLFAGLVHACRYCGLLEPSVAAHEHAKRIDPAVRTSVGYSYYLLGEFDQALGLVREDHYLNGYAYIAKGQTDEAKKIYRKTQEMAFHAQGRAFLDSYLFALSGDRAGSLALLRSVTSSSFRDPEGLYINARAFAFQNERPEAMETLRRVVEGGYYQPAMMTRDPWFDPLRTDREFISLLRSAEARRREAVAAYFAHGGDRILGVSPAA